MNKKISFLQRPFLLLLATMMLCSLLAFSTTPMAKAEFTATENNDINALAMGYAWITTYTDAGALDDIVALPFGHTIGYNTELSAYIGDVADTINKSYVINWRPSVLGNSLQVCGMRVAYRLPLSGGGFSSTFSYIHFPGTVLLPRDSSVEWGSDPSGGCIYLKTGSPYVVFNINLNIPEGSRIDYLRVYYHRTGLTYLPFIRR